MRVISLTSQYNLLHETLNGDCYPVPSNVVDFIETQKKFPFLHKNGVITGPIAFLNHECANPVVFGFDWEQRYGDVAMLKWSGIPCYLSYNFAYDKDPTRMKKIPTSKYPPIRVGDEVLVAYFYEIGAIDGDQNWFDTTSKCLCRKCDTIRSVNQQPKKRRKQSSVASLPSSVEEGPCDHVPKRQRRKLKVSAISKKPRVVAFVKKWIKDQKHFAYHDEVNPYLGWTAEEIQQGFFSFLDW